MEMAMDLLARSATYEIVAGGLGWLWIGSILSIIGLIPWALFGTGRWYYPIIALVAGTICKNLCRDLKKRSDQLHFKSVWFEHSEQWKALSDDQQINFIISTFETGLKKHAPQISAEAWIVANNAKGTFEMLAAKITNDYWYMTTCKSYQDICQIFVENYLTKSLAVEKL
jgi:hypothetical protein